MNGKHETINPTPRAKTYSGPTIRYQTNCGWVYITVNSDDNGRIVEVFARMGKTGGCSGAFLESIGRTISIALQCGVDPKELASQYDDIKCLGQGLDQGSRMNCALAVAAAIRHVIEENKIGHTT